MNQTNQVRAMATLLREAAKIGHELKIDDMPDDLEAQADSLDSLAEQINSPPKTTLPDNVIDIHEFMSVKG